MELKIERTAKNNSRIVALGGTSHHGQPWLTTAQGVIVAMTEGDRFYTWNPNQKHKDYVRAIAVEEVEALTNPDGGLIYLQTWADSLPTDNLLSLPDCPSLPTEKDVTAFKELVRP